MDSFLAKHYDFNERKHSTVNDEIDLLFLDVMVAQSLTVFSLIQSLVIVVTDQM